MTLKDMTDLVMIYDASEQLHAVGALLYGADYGTNEGIVGALDQAVEIISRHSPLFDSSADVGTGPFWQVLMGNETTVERARKLMGIG